MPDCSSHFAELWYVFGHLNQEPWRWTNADRRVVEEISGYWINFAKTGNPNGRGLPHWPAFASVDGKVLYIGAPITVGGVANINNLKVFDSVYTMVRGKPLPYGSGLRIPSLGFPPGRK